MHINERLVCVKVLRYFLMPFLLDFFFLDQIFDIDFWVVIVFDFLRRIATDIEFLFVKACLFACLDKLVVEI
jgi:hypothetical protein